MTPRHHFNLACANCMLVTKCQCKHPVTRQHCTPSTKASDARGRAYLGRLRHLLDRAVGLGDGVDALPDEVVGLLKQL